MSWKNNVDLNDITSVTFEGEPKTLDREDRGFGEKQNGRKAGKQQDEIIETV